MKVVGKNVLVIGDLHFSDVYTGKHKSYLTNCCEVLGEIIRKVQAEKPDIVVFLGDLIGWTETNIKDRQIFSLFLKAFQDINRVAKVFSVRGNHDMKGYPDFNLLAQIGLINTSETTGGYFDLYPTEDATEPQIRCHLVDYGNEEKELPLHDKASNIVFGHNNYTISGVTNWYAEHDGIELSRLVNYSGVDIVISGHIHNPSPSFVATQMADEKTCALFYVGCPTRPVKDKNNYESVWWFKLKYDADEDNMNMDTEQWVLKPIDEVFYSDETFIENKSEDELAEEQRTEQLKEVLSEIIQHRIASTDPREQIANIPNATEEAKELAKKYLDIALTHGNE